HRVIPCFFPVPPRAAFFSLFSVRGTPPPSPEPSPCHGDGPLSHGFLMVPPVEVGGAGRGRRGWRYRTAPPSPHKTSSRRASHHSTICDKALNANCFHRCAGSEETARRLQQRHDPSGPRPRLAHRHARRRKVPGATVPAVPRRQTVHTDSRSRPRQPAHRAPASPHELPATSARRRALLPLSPAADAAGRPLAPA